MAASDHATRDDATALKAPDLAALVPSFGGRVIGLSPFVFVAGCLLVTLLRTGIYLSWQKSTWVNAARAFPHHAQYFYESWLYLGLPKLLDLTTLDRFIAFYVFVALLSLGLLFAIPQRRLGTDRGRLFILVVLASAIPPTISYEIGFYDQLAILGALLVAMCNRRSLVAVGALVLSGANPSQAVVAAVALSCVTFAPGFRQLREKAATALAVAVPAFVVVHLWLSHVGVGGRETQLWRDIHDSLRGFAAGGGLLVASWYEAAWLLVLALIAVTPTTKGRIVMATGLVFLPGVACLTTLDGTRVFVSVAALPFLCVAWEWAASLPLTPALSRAWAGTVALGALIVPALYYRGDVLTVWLPWWWLMENPHFT